ILERNKPVLFQVDGGCNSAMYWIASNGDEIHSDYKLSYIGGIGVYATLMDLYPYYEAMGIKVEDVYSDFSTEKNEDYREWAKGNDQKIKEDINLYAAEFIDVVSTNRGFDKGHKVFKGGTFDSEKALSFGLIDGRLTFEATVNRCFEMSQDYQ